MDSLFGRELAEDVRERMENLDPYQRELCIVEAYCQVLSKDGRYVLPFRFKSESGKRTSHHLIHVTKHSRGYTIMKDVMYRESSEKVQGVASFEYNPAFGEQGILFEYARPLDELENRLLNEFSGQKITVQRLFDEHNIGKRYVMKNYKDVLRSMFDREIVTAYRENGKKITRGFPEDIVVVFPETRNGN